MRAIGTVPRPPRIVDVTEIELLAVESLLASVPAATAPTGSAVTFGSRLHIEAVDEKSAIAENALKAVPLKRRIFPPVVFTCTLLTVPLSFPNSAAPGGSD